MAIVDIFSKRQARLRGEVPDVYQYEEIPRKLRVQIIRIWNAAYGISLWQNHEAYDAFEEVEEQLCREHGILELTSAGIAPSDRVNKFLIETDDIEKVLDAVELTFQHLERLEKEHPFRLPGGRISVRAAIDEANDRFIEQGVGYRYESGQIVRVDSELVHAEIVKPTLKFLVSENYDGANQEFLSAHGHYRSGRYKECINDCLKAFESTMKAICDKRKWEYPANGTAKSLIEAMFNQGLVPEFLQSEFTGLRSTLESGIPTVRNKQTGHGQGSKAIEIPESLASYVLHLTATTILFLAKAESELP